MLFLLHAWSLGTVEAACLMGTRAHYTRRPGSGPWLWKLEWYKITICYESIRIPLSPYSKCLHRWPLSVDCNSLQLQEPLTGIDRTWIFWPKPMRTSNEERIWVLSFQSIIFVSLLFNSICRRWIVSKHGEAMAYSGEGLLNSTVLEGNAYPVNFNEWWTTSCSKGHFRRSRRSKRTKA